MMKALPSFTLTLALFFLAGFAVPSAGQEEQTSPAKAPSLLAEARAAADLEGDIEGALALYEKAAEDRSLRLREREEALYEAARLYRRLKRDAKAIQILRRLSAGSTPWSVKAKALLRGKSSHQEQDAIPEKRIRIALGKLYKNTHAKEGLAELKLIGQPAIPFLVKALNGQRDNLVFVGNAVEAIATIGGPRVKGWLASVLADQDVYYRRAVVQKLADPERFAFRTALEPFLHQLLRDEDRRIVLLTISAFRGRRDLVTPDDLTAILDRNDVRLATSMIVTFNAWDYAATDPTFARDAAKKLIALLPGLSEQDERSVVQVLRRICLKQPETASMFLKALVASLSRDSSDEGWANQGLFPDAHWKKTETVSARDFLNLARLFPKETFTRFHAQPTAPRSGFQRVQSFVVSAKSFTKSWNPDDIPAALELLDLGVYPWRNSSTLEKWIARNAAPEQLPRVVKSLGNFKHPGALFDRLRAEKGREDFVPPLKQWIEGYLGPERKLPENGWQLLNSAVGALVHQRAEEGYRYAVGLVRSNPALFGAVAERFKTVTDDPAVLPFLEQLIALPGEDAAWAARARYPLWVALYRAGNPRSIPALIAGARLGMRGRSTVKRVDLPLFEATTFSAADQARIWKGILDGREKELGGDVYVVLRDAGQRRPILTTKDLPHAVVAVILDATFDMSPEDRQAVLSKVPKSRLDNIPHRFAFFARVLRELGPAEQRMILGALDAPLTPELVALVTKLLASKDRTVVYTALRTVRRRRDVRFAPAIRRILAGDDGGLRSDAVTTLVALEKERALETILPLAKDASSAVRQSVFSSLMLIPDRRAIPVLVEALRDPEKKVRQVAEATLKRLQFYFDQKERWERWMKGVGLDAGSAADALLQQAAPDQGKEVRLAALRSLGTLGVAETLPILIRFMQENDPDIARAAKEAVDRINQRAERKPAKK